MTKPMYVRVKDTATGHELDVPETDPRIGKGLFEPVKDDRYPRSRYPRRPKHHTDPARYAADRYGDTGQAEKFWTDQAEAPSSAPEQPDPDTAESAADEGTQAEAPAPASDQQPDAKPSSRARTRK